MAVADEPANRTSAPRENPGQFSTGEAATTLIILVLRDVAGEWKISAREWTEATRQFALLFEERFKIA